MQRCDGVTRREFLRVGSLSALGLSLADVLRLRAGQPQRLPNCILVWLDGGPSHLDTFDLKRSAPAGFTQARLERRRDFLRELDQLSAEIEESALRQERDAQFEQAYRLIFSPDARRAFDLTQETQATRQRYGLHRVGQSCLLARRLIEAGCPFVTVTDDGWDTHQTIVRALREGFVGG